MIICLHGTPESRPGEVVGPFRRLSTHARKFSTVYRIKMTGNQCDLVAELAVKSVLWLRQKKFAF